LSESGLSFQELTVVPAERIAQAATKAVCVTRNYRAHARELGNPIPEAPVFFIKTPNCLCPMAPSIAIPVGAGPCHHELELYVVIAKELTLELAQQAPLSELIEMVGLGIDLTLRQVQQELKAQALPWERAKSFDGSGPISQGILFSDVESHYSSLSFALEVNGESRQQGQVQNMIFDLRTLLIEVSRFMTLVPGDLLFTGTPEGVGPLEEGDQVEVFLGVAQDPTETAKKTVEKTIGLRPSTKLFSLKTHVEGRLQ